MPRIARKYSKSNFYHVIVQGINKEYIFNTEFNMRKYKEFILKKIDRESIEIISYCIMNNHAHFLIYCENIKHLTKFMQRLNTSYSRFYNTVNKRVGYVFRDRFLSQNILSEKQLYNCVNYIHSNPIKAGIVKNIWEYKYSSYYELITEKSIVTNKGIKLLFGSEKNYKEQLDTISREECKEKFLDIQEEKKNVNDFVKEIEKSYGKKFNVIKEEKNELKEVIERARKETDATIIKLAELLEVSKSTVGNYSKK